MGSSAGIGHVMIRNITIRVLLIQVMLLTFTACGSDDEAAPDIMSPSAQEVSPQAPGRLSGVISWAYQLQDIDVDQLAASRFDLLVIDYADDEGRPFARPEVERLQEGGRVVLAYLSIGEAETYRPYWNPDWTAGGEGDCGAALSDAAPAWLDPVNLEWCGNYPVQFWEPAWQSIVFEYLDTIQQAGFDGVYLDKVDTFYYWLGEEDLGASFTNTDAAVQMADFVMAIARRAREHDAEFLIVPQNAAEIIEYLPEGQGAAYLAVIDGIGVEDTFFYPRGGAEAGNNAPYNPQGYILDLLLYYQEAGVPVFAIDYVTQPAKVERFYAEARDWGFVPYATVRDLDRLTVNTGYDP